VANNIKYKTQQEQENIHNTKEYQMYFCQHPTTSKKQEMQGVLFM
jgi:hypothetical protein